EAPGGRPGACDPAARERGRASPCPAQVVAWGKQTFPDMGETDVSPTGPLPFRVTRLRATWLRRAKPASAGVKAPTLALSAAVLISVAGAQAAPLAAPTRVGGDWTRFGYDAARSNTGPAATGITSANATQLVRQQVQ